MKDRTPDLTIVDALGYDFRYWHEADEQLPTSWLCGRRLQRVKVLSVHTGFGPFSRGDGERTYQMCVHLLEAGHDIRMLITDRWMQNGEVPQGYPFPLERLTVLPLINRRYNVPWPRWREIDRAVADADVIYLTGHFCALAPFACAAALRHGKPWVVCPAGVLPIRGRSIALKRAFNALYGNWSLARAARLIAITEDERAVLVRYASSAGRVVVIPNAVAALPQPQPEADFRRSFRLGSAPYLLFLGGTPPTKGVDLLLGAFSRVAEGPLAGYLLVIAGYHETQRREVENLVRAHGLAGRIRLAGFLLRGGEKEAGLHYAAAVVIPSRRDAMTIAVLEAGMASRPVLATTGCGFPEVANEGAGVVVEPTVPALAEGLRRLADARADWPQMGRRLRSIAARHSWVAMTERYVSLLQEVVAEARREP